MLSLIKLVYFIAYVFRFPLRSDLVRCLSFFIINFTFHVSNVNKAIFSFHFQIKRYLCWCHRRLPQRMYNTPRHLLLAAAVSSLICKRNHIFQCSHRSARVIQFTVSFYTNTFVSSKLLLEKSSVVPVKLMPDCPLNFTGGLS